MIYQQNPLFNSFPSMYNTITEGSNWNKWWNLKNTLNLHDTFPHDLTLSEHYQHLAFDSTSSKWAIMKPIEVKNVGVMPIFVKSFPGQKKIGKLLSQLWMQFSQTLIFQYNLVILPVKSRDSEVSEYVEHLYNRALVRDVKVPQHSKKLLRVILYMNSYNKSWFSRTNSWPKAQK